MSFWETITGNDITKQYKELQQRAAVLPAGYQQAWEQIVSHLAPYGNFSGRNLLPILDNALALLEEAAADGQTIHEALGGDIAGFSAALAGETGARTYRDRWREQLNNNVARKLSRLEK